MESNKGAAVYHVAKSPHARDSKPWQIRLNLPDETYIVVNRFTTKFEADYFCEIWNGNAEEN